MIIEGDASDDFFFLGGGGGGWLIFLRHVSADRHVRLGHHVVVLGYDQDGGAWWRNSRSTVINDDASDIFFYVTSVLIVISGWVTETHPPRVKKRSSVSIQTIVVLFVLAQTVLAAINDTPCFISVVCNKLTTVWAPPPPPTTKNPAR